MSEVGSVISKRLPANNTCELRLVCDRRIQGPDEASKVSSRPKNRINARRRWSVITDGRDRNKPKRALTYAVGLSAPLGPLFKTLEPA